MKTVNKIKTVAQKRNEENERAEGRTNEGHEGEVNRGSGRLDALHVLDLLDEVSLLVVELVVVVAVVVEVRQELDQLLAVPEEDLLDRPGL